MSVEACSDSGGNSVVIAQTKSSLSTKIHLTHAQVEQPGTTQGPVQYDDDEEKKSLPSTGFCPILTTDTSAHTAIFALG